MSKIEYLLRRYAGEYSKFHHAPYWEAEMMGIDACWYFYKRLYRKGITMEGQLAGIKQAVERAKESSIRPGSEVDYKIKLFVAELNVMRNRRGRVTV